MPAEISHRLTNALTDAGALGQPAIPTQFTEQAQLTERAERTESTRRTEQAERRLTAVPGIGDRVAGGRDRVPRSARRRWSRMAGAVTVAAAAVAFAGFGLSRLGVSDVASNGGSADSAAAPVVSGPVPPIALPAAQQLIATGTDYLPDSLPKSLASRLPANTEERSGTDAASPPNTGSLGTFGAAPEPDRGPIAAGLARLADRDALTACLEAIALAHGRGAVTFNLVDYATFEGVPALVISLTDGTGGRWAWVSGADCGLPTSGADTRYQSQVG